jgi:hypothetical protein
MNGNWPSVDVTICSLKQIPAANVPPPSTASLAPQNSTASILAYLRYVFARIVDM